jgi:hypothetical protein
MFERTAAQNQFRLPLGTCFSASPKMGINNQLPIHRSN